MGKWLRYRADLTPLAPETRTPRLGARLRAWLRMLAPIAAFAVVLFAAAPASAQFIWTFTKTASPTTYSAAGQVITYSYVVTHINNFDNDPIVAITVNDNKAGAASCPATVLAEGASMTCTASYVITAADVAAGSVTNVATARTDRCADGCIETLQAQATVNFVPQNGSITIVKQSVGGNNTFNFTSSVPGAASFPLTTAGGTVTRVFSNLAAGTYTFAETNLPFRWRLASIGCTGDAGGTPTVVTLASGSVSVGLDAGENITCTFVNEFQNALQQQLTSDFIRLFLTKRLLLLANSDPDRAHWFRRIPGAFWGDDDGFGDTGGSDAPFNYSATSGASSDRMSFSTSLSQIARAEAAAARRMNPAEDAFASFTKAKPRVVAQPGVDLWIEAHYNNFWSESGRLNNRGNFGVVYAGADLLATRSILVGALAQFDWIGERSGTQGTRSDGHGYFVGPYMAARLTKNLMFDARVAWGQSDNLINPFGLYEDNFSTTRWLARANLTGNWRFGNFRLSPSGTVIYISEHQHAYVDKLAVPIASQTVSLGRLTVGPEIGYRIVHDNGAVFEPHAALKASWDFAKPAAALVGGYLVTQDDVRLAAQLGLLARFPSGQSWRVAAIYDGIGSSNLQSIGGQFWINIPLYAPPSTR